MHLLEKKLSDYKIVDILSAFFVFTSAAVILYGISVTYLPVEIFPTALTTSIILCISLSSSLVLLLRKYPLTKSGIGLAKSKTKQIFYYGIWYGIICAILGFPYPIWKYGYENQTYSIVGIDYPSLTIIVFLVSEVLIVPVVEEIFYRWCIYKILRAKFDVYHGILITSFLFSVVHIPQSLALFLKLFVFSIIFTYAFEKTKMLGTSIVSHIILNFSWYSIVYYKLLQAGLG